MTVSLARTAAPMTAPVVPLMHAGQVDRENRSAVGVDGLDHFQRLVLYRPVETCAEQRIDDQRGLADRLGIERQHGYFHPLAAEAASPLRASRSHNRMTETSRPRAASLPPRQSRRRHCPGPAITTIGPPSTISAVGRLGHGLARTEHEGEAGVPAAMASRSARSISAVVVRTSMPNFPAKIASS